MTDTAHQTHKIADSSKPIPKFGRRSRFCRANSFHVSFTSTIVPDVSRIATFTGSALSSFISRPRNSPRSAGKVFPSFDRKLAWQCSLRTALGQSLPRMLLEVVSGTKQSLELFALARSNANIRRRASDGSRSVAQDMDTIGQYAKASRYSPPHQTTQSERMKRTAPGPCGCKMIRSAA